MSYSHPDDDELVERDKKVAEELEDGMFSFLRLSSGWAGPLALAILLAGLGVTALWYVGR